MPKRLLFLLLLLAPAALPAAALCDHPLKDTEVPARFETLAGNQLALEFGRRPQRFHDLRVTPVGRDMLRVEAMAVVRRPGETQADDMFVTGWISRCQGTLLIHNNTWLADGSLDAPRFRPDQLPGHGVVLGPKDAPVQIIAFVDSRCAQCHLLIEYGRSLAAVGRMRLELRQVAMLEPVDQALADTRLPESPLIAANHARISTGDYLDLLSGMGADATIAATAPAYKTARAMVVANTRTARQLLHLRTTPGVLVRDGGSHGGYRLTGHWEMNRLFQPDL